MLVGLIFIKKVSRRPKRAGFVSIDAKLKPPEGKQVVCQVIYTSDVKVKVCYCNLSGKGKIFAVKLGSSSSAVATATVA